MLAYRLRVKREPRHRLECHILRACSRANNVEHVVFFEAYWESPQIREPSAVTVMPSSNNTVPDHETIAIIDDDPAICDSTQLLLEIYGFVVHTYQRGTEFLDKNPAADCLLVDYQIPDLNGLDLITELRKRGRKTPALLITATSDKGVEQQAAALGIQVLKKPLPAQVLYAAIRQELD
jgi:two-component system, LuxR family, response regulator FixJ